MKRSIISLVLAGFAMSAMAQIDTDSLPKFMQTEVKKGSFVVEKKFPVEGTDLTGWVIKAGDYSIVYSTKDGKHLIAGALIAENGENLSQKYASMHIPKPDYAKNWDAVTKAATIVTGAQGKDVKATLNVFFDPNCVYCHLFAKAAQEYAKVGLQVRWIPVAFLRPDSEGKAATIMEASDPGAKLTEHVNGQDFKKHSGGVAAAKSVSAKVKDTLKSNNELMAAMGIRGTPGIVYKDKSGEIRVNGGMMGMKGLAEATGLPLQTTKVPELAPFAN